MARKQTRNRALPSYRRHCNGQGFSKFKGRNYYFGKFGSEESEKRYELFLAELRSSPQCVEAEVSAHFPPVTNVNQVAAAYWAHARIYYRKADSRRTSELSNVKCALKPLALIYGMLAAHDFGTVKLETIREHLVSEGLAGKRSTILSA